MICINGKFLNQKIAGVQRYALEISKKLPSTIGEEEVCLLVPRETEIPKELKKFKIFTFGKFKGNLWEQIDVPLFLAKKNKPLLINFSGISPVFYHNKYVFIHDLIFKHHPEWFSKTFAFIYNLMIPLVARKAKKVITVSQYSKSDIHESYKIPNEKIEVVYAAASEFFERQNIHKEKIILAVSSLDPRKNFKRIIDAYNQLTTDYKLIIVGKKHVSFSSEKLNNVQNENIIFTGYLSDEDLIMMYNKATVFVYPSLFEGFGIPPLEAQKVGCPVIASPITSMPEVLQNSVIYCDPLSVEDIKEKLQLVLTDQDLRKKLISKGVENEKRFNWGKSAEKLKKLIIENGFVK